MLRIVVKCGVGLVVYKTMVIAAIIVPDSGGGLRKETRVQRRPEATAKQLVERLERLGQKV